MLCEQKNTHRDESGYQLQLDEIAFNQIDLKWGSYVAPHEKILSFHPDKPSIVSHFRILDAARSAGKQGTAGGSEAKSGLGAQSGTQSIPEKQFVVYRELAEPYDLYVSPTNDKTCSFFEMIMSDHFFDSLFTEESKFLVRFHNCVSTDVPSFDFTAPMTPAMYAIIQEMRNAPYSGYLKGIYLEAKAVELFLTQVKQLDCKDPGNPSKLRPKDIESLHAIRDYIDLHYDQPWYPTDGAHSYDIVLMVNFAGTGWCWPL
jgi:hypothetical protein